MSKVLKKIIVDCETKEVTEIAMTPDEIAEHETSMAQFAEQQAQRESEESAKELAKQSANKKLAALGLSAEEIAAITGA